VLADKGLSNFRSYDQIRQGLEKDGRRDATKILTIATAHVEYESRSDTTPTSTAPVTPTTSRT